MVEYDGDGCRVHQCLKCYNFWTMRSNPDYGWKFCPFCGIEWKGQWPPEEERKKADELADKIYRSRDNLPHPAGYWWVFETRENYRSWQRMREYDGRWPAKSILSLWRQFKAENTSSRIYHIVETRIRIVRERPTRGHISCHFHDGAWPHPPSQG